MTTSLVINRDVSYNPRSLAEGIKAKHAGYKSGLHIAWNAIFYTIQGEAPFTGKPAIFLRLSGCNRGSKEDRGCAFCDTFFSLDGGFISDPDEMLIALRREYVKACADLGVGSPEMLDVDDFQRKFLLVVSGGEPMLQAAALHNLFLLGLPVLKHMFHSIQFESNGDYHGTGDTLGLLNFMEAENAEHDGYFAIVCSPKGRVTPYDREDIDLPYAGRLKGVMGDSHVYYRFLAATSEHFDGAYSRLPRAVNALSNTDNVFVSPITIYKKQPAHNEIAKIETDIALEETRSNVALAIKLAYQNNATVSFQAHSYIGIA